MLESLARLYPLLIVAGLTVAAVLSALRYQARKRERLALELIRLNEELGFDTLAFLESGSRRLVEGGFGGLAWTIDWFGIRRIGSTGECGGKPWERQIDAPDICLMLRFYPGRLGGERRYFAEQLCESFTLLLKTDIWIKAGTTASALSEFQRLTLFLCHDVKNLAQFIQIAGDQMENLAPDDESRYLSYLRTAFPLFRERSERIIGALMERQPIEGRAIAIPLAPAARRLCESHRLAAQVRGDAEVRMPPASLDTILDNLVRNCAEHAPDTAVAIDITGGPSWASLRLSSVAGQPEGIDLLRLFEPFWTDSPAGLGLGLYQARQLARDQGGELGAELMDGKRLCFTLTLPSALP
ncbi:MAG: hypothetical protein H6R10_323 [Rhodocyclaceae bacterium]|nr:hypothetical protein [Rhodocyclaceae bacterium]